MNNIDIEPCPFCGSATEVYDYEYGEDCCVAWGCGCVSCAAYVSGKNTATEAIESWNSAIRFL